MAVKKGLNRPERLMRIKQLIEHFQDGPLTQSEIAGMLNMSGSGVRKDIKMLSDALIISSQKEGLLNSLRYKITNDYALINRFLEEIDNRIKMGNRVFNPLKVSESEQKIVVGHKHTHHKVAPGRTIYRMID